jgi:S-adenosylmethionine-dependent methyltransferase
MDRNFDGLSQRFNNQIYGTLKGKLRLKMLDEDIASIIESEQSLQILDVGGGMGQFSSILCALGHEVTLTDISSEMLVEAKAIFQEVAPNRSAEFICTPLQDLAKHTDKQYDLVLNHAVLEWLADPLQAVETLNQFVKPKGHLSLMFYNRHSIVWRNLMNGSWQRAHNDSFHHDKNALMPQNPLDPQEVYNKLTDLGYNIVSWRGIRCVHDHMPKFMRDKKTLDEFVSIEKELGLTAPYRDLGRYVHFVCKKSN